MEEIGLVPPTPDSWTVYPQISKYAYGIIVLSFVE